MSCTRVRLVFPIDLICKSQWQRVHQRQRVHRSVCALLRTYAKDLSLHPWRCVISHTDQGSVGLGGYSYCTAAKERGGLNLMWINYGDCYHRTPNDVGLACLHTRNGELKKAMLHSTYIWSLNYKPFQSGGFGDEKKDGAQQHNNIIAMFPTIRGRSEGLPRSGYLTRQAR